MRPPPFVILIAPNVSEQMGGEAIKALHIFTEIKKLNPSTIQITHARCRSEISRLGLTDVYFVNDTLVSLAIWRSVILRPLLDIWFSVKALRMADDLARQAGKIGDDVIIHQTEPNSPVTPRFVSTHHPNVFGPINGNIYYPAAFRSQESLRTKFRRIFHRPAQIINRFLFHGKTWADAVLCAGGQRTRSSLRLAGYPEDIVFDSLDCGVPDDLFSRPRISHEQPNLHFVHFGRIVFHKGTAMAIKAIAKTPDLHMDIIGRGPHLDFCKKLATDLGLEDRIRFLDWLPQHNDLIESLSKYRGMILPSLEDANGIVVQEAMALGLPTICLDWGGPQLLIENDISGFLIDPISEEHIVATIADRLAHLASDPTLADRISIAARENANKWRWSKLAASWLAMYECINSPLFKRN